MTRRAAFTWDDDGATVRIIDLNTGSTSVTNDAENVIARLAASGVRVDHRCVIYRDSDGRWDRMLTNDGKFIGFDLSGACDDL